MQQNDSSFLSLHAEKFLFEIINRSIHAKRFLSEKALTSVHQFLTLCLINNAIPPSLTAKILELCNSLGVKLPQENIYAVKWFDTLLENSFESPTKLKQLFMYGVIQKLHQFEEAFPYICDIAIKLLTIKDLKEENRELLSVLLEMKLPTALKEPLKIPFLETLKTLQKEEIVKVKKLKNEKIKEQLKENLHEEKVRGQVEWLHQIYEWEPTWGVPLSRVLLTLFEKWMLSQKPRVLANLLTSDLFYVVSSSEIQEITNKLLPLFLQEAASLNQNNQPQESVKRAVQEAYQFFDTHCKNPKTLPTQTWSQLLYFLYLLEDHEFKDEVAKVLNLANEHCGSKTLIYDTLSLFTVQAIFLKKNPLSQERAVRVGKKAYQFFDTHCKNSTTMPAQIWLNLIYCLGKCALQEEFKRVWNMAETHAVFDPLPERKRDAMTIYLAFLKMTDPTTLLKVIKNPEVRALFFLGDNVSWVMTFFETIFRAAHSWITTTNAQLKNDVARLVFEEVAHFFEEYYSTHLLGRHITFSTLQNDDSFRTLLDGNRLMFMWNTPWNPTNPEGKPLSEAQLPLYLQEKVADKKIRILSSSSQVLLTQCEAIEVEILTAYLEHGPLEAALSKLETFFDQPHSILTWTVLGQLFNRLFGLTHEVLKLEERSHQSYLNSIKRITELHMHTIIADDINAMIKGFVAIATTFSLEVHSRMCPFRLCN